MSSNAKPLLIRGGRIIDPDRGIDEVGSLLIRAGKIALLSAPSPLPDCIELNAEGLVVCPGFIDLHCHLREPGFEEKETIATGTRAAARGGFTTVCCMPNTSPALDNREVINYVNSIAAREGVIRVLPIGAVTVGRKGETLAPLDEMAAAGAIAFSDDGAPVSNANLMRQALDYSVASGLPIIEHCEDVALAMGGQINEGVVSNELGLRGMPHVAEENMIVRDLALARQTGGRLHIAHASTAGSVELIRRGKEQGINITAEVTPHHLTLTEEAVIIYGTVAKVNPPLRTQWDVQALVQGLRDNVIDIIVTDHAPHAEVDKKCEFTRAAFGISGLETALGSLMNLVHSRQITLTDLITRLTGMPAGLITIGKRLGTLGDGCTADVTIFDPDREWVVDTNAFASKGENTPLEGARLKGKVMATVYKGKLVYKDDFLTLTGEYKGEY